MLTVKNHLIEFGGAQAQNFALFARFPFEIKYNSHTSTATNVHTGSYLIGVWCSFSPQGLPEEKKHKVFSRSITRQSKPETA